MGTIASIGGGGGSWVGIGVLATALVDCAPLGATEAASCARELDACAETELGAEVFTESRQPTAMTNTARVHALSAREPHIVVRLGQRNLSDVDDLSASLSDLPITR